MGSSQSISSSGGSSDPSPTSLSSSSKDKILTDKLHTDMDTAATSGNGNVNDNKKNKKPIDVNRKCRKHKRAWSRCVADHYEKKFLPGKSLEPEQDCDDFFDKFKDCYMKGMIKQRQERSAEPPKKDSMLHEYMVEEGMLDDGDDGNNKE